MLVRLPSRPLTSDIMNDFAAQLEKAKKLAASGSLVVPPPQSENLWLPPVKEPEPEFTRWEIFFDGLSNYAPPPFNPRSTLRPEKEKLCPAF